MSESTINLEIAQEWLVYAKDALDYAEYFFGKRPLQKEIICFFCQQSAEKILKGLLALHGICPPEIHDLMSLCDLCRPFVNEINKISKRCEKLNPYSVAPRYLKEIPIVEQQIRLALVDAREVLEFCLPFYPNDDEIKIP
ncbi:MAG: HEPN domain-containing protein [Planctomycetaceae bacterium]|jgi:HEPN domain-containing protein|nr:HEPN domain-containing protein [Planctomycetaceae bacterium]